MFKPSKELETLKSIISAAPDGAYFTYATLEEVSGVKMNTRGKSILRSAFRSLGREYYCDRGAGIEIESSNNAMQLVTGRMKRVSNGLKKADKTTNNMVVRHLEQMPVDDRNRLLATASLFGAIKSMAKGLSDIYKPRTLNVIIDKSLEVPKFR